MPGPAEPTRRKAELRRLARERRAARPLDDSAATRLADVLLGVEAVARARTVAAYVSYGIEPPTGVVLDRLAAARVRVLLPVVLPDLGLDWAVHDGRLVAGLRQSLEPSGPRLGPDAIAAAEVVVVPALAVDRAGTRLGQGGGSYDRALALVGDGALLVALLAADDEVLAAGVLPVDDWDRPVDVAVTPTSVIDLG